jgi:hypothetical protein
MKRLILSVAFAVCAVVLGAPSAGRAAVLSYSNAVPSFIGFQDTDFTNVVSLPQFDSSIGTLTGLTFRIDSRVYSTIGVENTSESVGVNPTITAQTSFRAAFPSSAFVLTNLVTQADANFSLSAYDGTEDYTGTSGGFTTNGAAVGSGSRSLSGAALAPYIGLSNVLFTVSTFSGFSAAGTGNNLVIDLDTFAGSNIEIQYFYEPIPEPGTVAALALVAPALLGRRRRR